MLRAVDGKLIVSTPFNRGFVEALKAAVPYWDRAWDGKDKVWIVSLDHTESIVGMIQRFFNHEIPVPSAVKPEPEITVLDLRYVGRVNTDTGVAHGFVGDGWNAVFPKGTLLGYFGQRERPDDSQTLYEVLGVAQTVAQSDLKKAYRKMAKIWHPDVSKEAEAAEQFQRVQEAYQILGDASIRAKYDAGLALEALWARAEDRAEKLAKKLEAKRGYRPPLRCGLVMVKAHRAVSGKLVVAEILHWGDITNGNGEILASTWEPGADTFREIWVEP